MNDKKIDNDEYIELVKLYEDYKENKKNKLSFLKLKFSIKNIFKKDNMFFYKNISTNSYY